MTTSSRSYAAITPVWNEARNLQRLADCLSEQTERPQTWIVVDTGSSDETREVAERLADTHAWIEVATSESQSRPEPGAPIVRAFHEGLRRLNPPPEFVVKLDADVSFECDYFERLLAAFEAEPSLGIASGGCWEQDKEGEWRETRVTSGHVRGATRGYRWACLRELLPLAERVGWDGVDELKANILGWRTGVIEGLPFFHHRRVGARDGARSSRWKAQGRGAHFMGYRFWYLVLRSLHRARSDPAAIWMIGGYLDAALRRESKYQDASVRAHLRRQQALRRLPVWARDALRRE